MSEQQRDYVADAKEMAGKGYEPEEEKALLLASFTPRHVPTLEEKRAMYEPGYIYIIRAANTSGVYKIGEAADPYKRNETQQKKHDYKIEIVTTLQVKDKWQIEQALHMRYHRYRLAGEWFASPDWALEEIKQVVEGMDGKL